RSLETTIGNLTRMTTPLALIVMGGTFNFGKLKDADWSLYGTVLARLVIIPTIALFIAGGLLDFRGADLISVLIATAGPTAVSSYAQAVVAGGDGDLANPIVVFTTVASMFSLVVFIMILKSLAYFEYDGLARKHQTFLKFGVLYAFWILRQMDLQFGFSSAKSRQMDSLFVFSGANSRQMDLRFVFS